MVPLAWGVTRAYGEAGLNHGSSAKAHMVLSQQRHSAFTRVPQVFLLELPMDSYTIKSFLKEIPRKQETLSAAKTGL